MRIDLGFADIVIFPGKFLFYGKKGGTIKEEGISKQVEPVKEGEVITAPERVLEAIGILLQESNKKRLKTKEQKKSAEIKNDEAQSSVILTPEASKSIEADSQETSQEISQEDNQESSSYEEQREKIFRFRGKDGFSVIMIATPRGIWMSIAKRQDNTIVEKSAGLIRPSLALVLAEAIAATVLETGKFLKPLAGSALLVEKREVSFMDGSTGTTLTGTQKRELFNLLSCKFLSPDIRVNFKAGKVRLSENGEDFSLRVGRLTGKLNWGELMILRSICL